MFTELLTLPSSSTLLLAFLAGMIPALIWLVFFIHEDTHPEPRKKIAQTFVTGMIAVLIAIPLQAFVKFYLTGGSITLATLVGWAAIEELLKFGGAYLVALRTRIFDEPIDGLVYLLTAALGFAALENVLFLIPSLEQGLWLDSIITGNLRFIGATLVHVGASGFIGAAIAFSFYRRKFIKEEYLAIGLTGAIALHVIFNFFIINGSNERLFAIFSFIWIVVICIMLFFERAKQIKPPPAATNTPDTL